MSIVTVKNKYQVVIPQDLRKLMEVNVGDLLEAKVERGKIILAPKTLVDREIVEGLEDIKTGRTYGPYHSAAEMIRALHRMTRRGAKSKAKRQK